LLHRPSSAAGQNQGGFRLTGGEAAMHHVLFEVLCQLGVGHLSNYWGSGFNEIQDVLLMN